MKDNLGRKATGSFIVITSIFPPNEAIRKFAAHKSWQVVVVGDSKTPHDWRSPDVVYLSPDDQRRMNLELVDGLPWNTYARKMAGYAYALSQGAQIIADSDDDNIPYADWGQGPTFSGSFQVVQKQGFFNVYTLFTEKRIWPRGYPINRILESTSPDFRDPVDSIQHNVGVWQHLADGDPDVDAIYRMTDNSAVFFKKRKPVVLAKGTCCPFNSQNTLFRKETFPLLYLPAFVSFRFTDILRGLVAQPILWAAGYHLGFGPATVVQERNPHDYMRDFESEIPCYLQAESIVAVVGSVVSDRRSIPENLLEAYEALFKSKIVERRELDLLGKWLKLF